MRRAFAYSLMALLLPLQVCAQSLRKEIPHLDFADLQDNRIEFRGDSASFERFFGKLDSVLFFGEGNLNIVHIGGSHVQAGTLTRRLRNDLLSLRPALDGGRGLVFPFSAARTNNPSSFTVGYQGTWDVSKNTQREPARRLGLTGMALTTSDNKASVTVTMVARDPKPAEPVFRFNRVRVLGYSQTGEREPVVVAGPGDTLTAPRGEADSCWTFFLPAFTDSVRVATKGTGEFTFKGICLENPYPGISVTEIGVNGASLVSYAKCRDFESDLALLKPDMVILAVGINDATATDFTEDGFVQAYKALVARIRSVAPDCALLFITNNDSCRKVRRKGYVTNGNGQVAEQAFLRLGKDCGAGVWNLFKVMGGLGSVRDWEAAGLAKRDKVHFTESGYELVGDLLFNALMDSYVQHLKSSK